MQRDANANLLGRSLATWIDRLTDIDPTTRAVAAWAVGVYGAHAQAGRARLVGLLADADARVRAAATTALVELDDAAPDLPALLAPLVADVDPDVRESAVHALITLGERGAAALPDAFDACPPERRVSFLYAVRDMGPAAARTTYLFAMLVRERDPALAEAAMAVAEAVGPAAAFALGPLLAALHRQEEGVARAAARALGRLGEAYAAPTLAAPALVSVLAAAPASVQEAAAQALGNLGTATPEVIQALAGWLGHGERGVANAASEALSQLGSGVVPALLEALAADSPARRRDAAACLAKLGPAGADAAPGLVKALDDADRWVVLAAVDALAAVAATRSDVVPALVALTQAEDAGVRAGAAKALAAAGLVSEPALAGLVALLGDRDPAVRSAAVYASQGLAGPLHAVAAALVLVRALVRVLGEDPDDEVRLAAVHVLEKAGAAPTEVVPALIASLDDSNDLVRGWAAFALSQIGPAAAAAVPALVRLLQGPPRYTNEQQRIMSARASAALALGKMGEPAPAVIETLATAVGDREAPVRGAAVAALQALGTVSGKVTPSLIAALKDDSSDVRRAAAAALGGAFAEAESVVPALVDLLRDGDWRIREAAVKALGQLGPAAKPAAASLEQLWRDLHVGPAAAEALDRIGPLLEGEQAALGAAAAAGISQAIPAARPTLVTQAGQTQRTQLIAVSSDGALAVSDGATQLILWDVASGRELRRLDAGQVNFETLVAFGPGRLLLGSDKTVTIWDLATGAKIQELTATARVSAAAFSPHGKQLLLAGGPAAILCDIAAAQVLRVVQADATDIHVVAFSPDGRRAFAGSDRAAVVWDVETGQELSRVSVSLSVRAAAFSHDGRGMMLAAGDGLATWDFATNAFRGFGEPLAKVEQIFFAPDDSQVLVRGDDVWGDEIQLRRVRDGKTLVTTQARAVGYGPAGPVALSVTDREMQTIVVQDVASGRELRRLEARATFLTGVKFARAGDRVLLAGWGGATVWDLQQGRVIRTFNHPPSLTPPSRQMYEGRWRVGRITSAAFSPDGARVLTGASDKRAILWDVATGRPLRFLQLEAVVEGVAISPDGQRALLGGYREAVLFDLETGDEVYRLPGHAGAVRSVGFSEDGSKILTGSVESILWDAATGKELQRPAGNLDVNASVLSPDGRRALVGVQNAAACWDCVTGKIGPWLMGRTQGSAMSEDDFRRNRGHSGLVAALAFSPDGTKVLTGSSDGAVLAWDLAESEVVYQRFEGHVADITAATFSPDGRLVLTCSLDGAAILWDLASGARLCTLLPFKNGSWAVVDPEGRFDTDNLAEQDGYAWVFGDDPFRALPPEIFMRQYYEPRLLPRLMAGEVLAPVAPLGALNRVQPVVDKPIVHVQKGGRRARVTVTVHGASATYPRGASTVTMATGVYDLRLFRDGQLVAQWPAQAEGALLNDADLAGWRAATHLCGPGASATATFTVNLPLTPDRTSLEISAYAFNADRVKSEAVAVQVDLPTRTAAVRPRAYVVTVGVNAYESQQWDLRFAANDAVRLGEVVSRRLQGYEVTCVRLISDYEPGRGRLRENGATKALIQGVLKRLAGAAVDGARRGALPPGLQPATPDDLVLLFFAGHGFTDHAGVFYFFPHDIGAQRSTAVLPADLLARAISSDELSGWLRPIDAGTLVMIFDTCHSESAVEPPGFKLGPFGSRGLGQMAFDKGMRVLAASQSEGKALESATVKQGLLTYALIEEGLEAGRAGETGPVTLSAWLKYAAERVPALHGEVLAGKVRDLGEEDKDAGPTWAVQQPALFDFARSGGTVTFDVTRQSPGQP